MTRLAGRVPLRVRRQIIRSLPQPLWRRLRLVVHGQTAPQRAWRALRLSQLAKQAPELADGELRPLIHDGNGYLARTVTEFRSSEVLAHHLNLVADAFTAQGIRFAILDAEPQRRRVVVVARQQRSAALLALAAELGGGGTYLAAVRYGRAGSAITLGESELHNKQVVVRLFQVFASASGTFLGGPDLGCDIEFWAVTHHSLSPVQNGEPIESQSLIAPRPNRWTDVIGPDDRHTEDLEVDGVRRPVFTSMSHRHLFDVTEPIDVVYTWVDGSDSEWLERKAQAEETAGNTSDRHSSALSESRFLSRDELRYSLRSLDMYASWVRHVYIVTDGQVPPWLDTANPRITLVTHAELFAGRGQLPTFNSHAIESQLHHIENLSETFLYLNDDVFFGRPVTPDLFFHANGLSRFFMSEAKIGLGAASAADAPVMSAAKNNRDLVRKLFDRSVSKKLKHVPHALRRSVLFDLESEIPAVVDQTANSVFRHPTDISVAASLAHYYGYATGRAVPGQIEYFYADIAEPDTPYRLSVLLARRDFDVFCLNDYDSRETDGDPAAQAKMILDFLQGYFPLPSAFEIT